jgi:hypothetical protein
MYLCNLAIQDQFKPGMVAHTCDPSYLGAGNRRIVEFEVEVNPGKVRETLSQKYNTNKIAEGMVQMVETMPA